MATPSARDAEEIQARLARARVNAVSADCSVLAAVAGDGRLLGLHIAPGALDDTQPGLISRAVVQAVNRARHVAAERAKEEWAEFLSAGACCDLGRQVAAQQVIQPIDGGGTVAVSGYGRLLSAEVSTEAVRYSSPDSLALRITAAILAAELTASHTYDALISSLLIGGIPGPGAERRVCGSQ